jgi:Tol biopolymer transport system component
LASLSHPNVAAVHGLHQDGDTRFIAMELVSGEDLAARIACGAIEMREALGFARRIAYALEAAHERGVVHRDLKPANVVVDDTGTLKVLDFGLAKMVDAPGSQGSTSLSLSPTVTSAGTAHGMILGTAAYMSPEQVRGREVDRRTDLWAFGCMLYEMLTGRRPFGGETVSDALAGILKEEPDWSILPAETPRPIRRLLRRCLTKDRENRQSGAADARILIDEVLDGKYVEEEPDRDAPAIPAKASRVPWILAAALAVVAAILVWNVLAPTAPVPTSDDRRLSIAFPDDSFLVYRLLGGTLGSLALSPNGDRLVYVGEGETPDTTRLWVRDLDDFEPRPLTGTEGAAWPAFSQDGEWIVYARGETRLEKIPAVGGASVPIAETQSPRGVSWERPDRILYVPNLTGGVWSVGPEGGDPVQVTRPDAARKVISHRFPHMLPDGKHFLLTAKTSTLHSFDDALIMVASLETGETRTLLQGGMDARYHDGHLIYGRDGGLFAVPFDLESMKTSGTPFPIVDGVITSPAWGCAQYDLLPDGTIAYVPGGGGDSVVELAWGDPQGNLMPIGGPPQSYSSVTVAPDGLRAFFGVQFANDDIWMLDIERGSIAPFLTLDGNEFSPAISHDGRLIVFNSDREGYYDLYLAQADGTDSGELLVSDDANKEPFCFSPDDSTVLFTRADPETRGDLWLVPIEGERRPEPFLVTPAHEAGPDFSPDGRWIAYQSDDTGRFEIYVRPYPGPGPPIRISDKGGLWPRWATDGRTLYYRNAESLMAMPVEPGPNLRSGKARAVLTVPGKVFRFDTHPDGRILLALSKGTAERSHEVRLLRGALAGRR